MNHEFEVPADEFDVGLCLRSGQVFRVDGIESNLPGAIWTVAEGNHWYSIRRVGGTLFVTSNAEQAAFRDFARLDWNAKAVSAAIIQRGPEMVPYLAATSGLRVLRQSDPVETLFTFLCTANNHVSRIASMVRALAAYGDRFSDVAPEGRPAVFRFPELECLAGVGEAELRAKGFGYRGAWIAKTACELIGRGGRDYLLGLKRATYSEAHAELVSLTGVGPKLADCIALFGLDQCTAVPVDTHIWQALTRLYFPQYAGSALTPMKYREASGFFRERFGEYAGWAQQFLFYDNHANWRARVSARKVNS